MWRLICLLCVLQVLADDRVSAYFKGTDMAKQRAHQVGGWRMAWPQQRAVWPLA